MKKKITAAALALCLVLGLLPMSALAARYTGTLNGAEITLDVDDTTGKVTLPSGLAGHYSVSPDTLEVGSFPKSQEFTLTHYGEVPGTITVQGTLVEAPAGETFTVSFSAGDHASGAKERVSLTVPQGESSVKYTLPNAEGFTPESGYVFAGWLAESGQEVLAAGTEISVSADITLTAQWTRDETVLVAKPSVSDGAATIETLDVTAKTQAVILELQGDTASGATVTIRAAVVAKVRQNDVKTVEVKSTLATVTVPVGALPGSGDAALKVEAAQKAPGAPGTVTVSKAVSVTLTGVTSAAALDTPIRITLAVSAPENFVPAYWNAARNAYVRARGSIQNGQATFLTRHLTDFAVVSEAEPETLEVTGSGRSASAKVEPGETGLFVFEVRDGDGVRSIATTASAQSSSGGQVTVSGGTTLTGAVLKSAYALERAPGEFGDSGFTVTPADIMAEHTAQ